MFRTARGPYDRRPSEVTLAEPRSLPRTLSARRLALAVALLLGLVPGVPTALSIPLCVLSSILAARFLYRKGLVRA